MKRHLCKTVFMVVALLATTLFVSCGKDDKYNQPANYTYYITTDHMTLAPGAPFTIDDVAKEYKYYFDLGCPTKYYNMRVLEDIIKHTYYIQATRKWVQYYHGYILIMCNIRTSNQPDEAMYKLDLDTHVLTQLSF